MTYKQLIYALFGAFSPFLMPGVQADDLPTQPDTVVTTAPSTTTGTDTSTTGANTAGSNTNGSSTTTTDTSTTNTGSTSTTTTDTTTRPTVKTPHRRTALELSQQYFDTRMQCEDGSPAYMCTGVMLRSNKSYSDEYHVWDPSPFSTSTGGTSFSWLRSDTRYAHLAFGYNSGFILFPQQKAPDDNVKVNALCYFLLDASSASRDNHGCGAATQDFPTTSDTCDHYSITTPEKWIEHYQSETSKPQLHQCGFDLTGDKTVAAERFRVATKAHDLLGTKGFSELNEFRLATWESGKAGQLPLQAFFYVADTTGLSDAQHYQLDYYNQTKAFLPVIRITMPKTETAHVQFNYIPSDQALTPVY